MKIDSFGNQQEFSQYCQTASEITFFLPASFKLT